MTKCAECGTEIVRERNEIGWLDLAGNDHDPEWCPVVLETECQVLVTVDGVAAGEKIGTCQADGRPIFRSRMAGTIYHASEDR